MPTPTYRTPVRVARGTYANLNSSVGDLLAGEICYATDQNKFYAIKNGTLTEQPYIEAGVGAVVNADISGSAGIAFSKLASLPSGQVIVGNSSNVPTSTAFSGDVTLSNTGAATVVSASTTVAGKVMLTDGVSSTSTSTAATPNSVKIGRAHV